MNDDGYSSLRLLAHFASSPLSDETRDRLHSVLFLSSKFNTQKLDGQKKIKILELLEAHDDLESKVINWKRLPLPEKQFKNTGLFRSFVDLEPSASNEPRLLRRVLLKNAPYNKSQSETQVDSLADESLSQSMSPRPVQSIYQGRLR